MGIHAVGNLSEAVRESGVWIYAWCVGCGNAKHHMERVCAAGAPAEVTAWRCEDCQIVPEGIDKTSVKPCPKCETMTEKISGCNHIACTVEGCGAHWCFFCGEQFGEDEVYTHMRTEHGGYYAGVENDEDEYESDFED